MRHPPQRRAASRALHAVVPQSGMTVHRNVAESNTPQVVFAYPAYGGSARHLRGGAARTVAETIVDDLRPLHGCAALAVSAHSRRARFESELRRFERAFRIREFVIAEDRRRAADDVGRVVRLGGVAVVVYTSRTSIKLLEILRRFSRERAAMSCVALTE